KAQAWTAGSDGRRRPWHGGTLFALATALVLMAAFGAWAADGFPRTVVDELGRVIGSERPPRRGVSWCLARATILGSLTDPRRVVGVTRYAVDAAQSYVVDRVGDHMVIVDALNAEQVLAAEPDIVLITDWNDPDVVRQLRDLGVRMYTFTGFDSVEDALDMILRIGEITGDDQRAAALVEAFRQRAVQVAQATAGRPRPKVLYLDDWWATVGPGIAYHDMIEMAGGINVAAEYGIQGWQPIDPEAVLEMNPDVIITSKGEAWLDQLRAAPVVQAVTAGREGRLYHLDHMEIHSQHYIRAIEELAALLHPEAFGR